MPAPVTKLTRLQKVYEQARDNPLPHVSSAKTMFFGNPDAKLMIVFSHSVVDPLGSDTAYLRASLKLAMLPTSSVFFAYAVKGSLLKPDGENFQVVSREATEAELEHYRSFLLEEIDIVKPEAILCIGGTAVKVLLGDPHFSVTREAGAELEIPGVPCPVIATLSFSYVVKTGGLRGKNHKQFMGDLLRAKALAEGTEEI